MFSIRAILPDKSAHVCTSSIPFNRRLGNLARRLPSAVLVICLALLSHKAKPASNSADGFEALATSAAAARQAGKPEEAIHDYQRALAIRPTWTEGWWYLGSLFFPGVP